ncbi:MAG: class I SAM-dependent methyltransferase [Anaerolineae bacterium]|nr:class I SAM-dependent methyltransferase [Anaerolineae bacterium]
MPEPTDQVHVQYRTDRNLNARIALHAGYSTNTYGWQRWVFDRMDLPASARILELGCGPGSLWKSNQHRIGARWRALLTDFSLGMATRARDNLAVVAHSFAFAVADAMTVPSPDGAFDSVIAAHMLYHVPDRDRVLMEIRRVLKSGGRFYATTVGQSHMRELWELVAPFVPDIHERASRVAAGFTLENGSEPLGRVFNDVVRHDYPDDLEVTEVQPIIDYIRSSNTLMDCDLASTEWAAIRRRIVAHIEVKGSFHIHKASGMFTARA